MRVESYQTNPCQRYRDTIDRERGLRTKSNAATFLFLLSWALSPELELPGIYFATSRVLGEDSSAERSCQLIFTGGFWDAGVKNEETAVSVDDLLAKFDKYYGD